MAFSFRKCIKWLRFFLLYPVIALFLAVSMCLALLELKQSFSSCLSWAFFFVFFFLSFSVLRCEAVCGRHFYRIFFCCIMCVMLYKLPGSNMLCPRLARRFHQLHVCLGKSTQFGFMRRCHIKLQGSKETRKSTTVLTLGHFQCVSYI